MGIGAIVGIVSALAGGASAYTSYRSGQQAKSRGRKAAKIEAANTREKAKRMREDQTRRLSLARARAAASGVGGASTEIYIDALEKSGREEIDWLEKVGASVYQQRLDEGQGAYSDAMAGFWGSAGEVASSGADLWNSYQDSTASPSGDPQINYGGR